MEYFCVCLSMETYCVQNAEITKTSTENWWKPLNSLKGNFVLKCKKSQMKSLVVFCKF